MILGIDDYGLKLFHNFYIFSLLCTTTRSMNLTQFLPNILSFEDFILSFFPWPQFLLQSKCYIDMIQSLYQFLTKITVQFTFCKWNMWKKPQLSFSTQISRMEHFSNEMDWKVAHLQNKCFKLCYILIKREST